MTLVRFFVYGTMLSGQRDHAILGNAELLGPAATLGRYTLVDIDVFAALLDDGKTSVQGELYAVEPLLLAAIDRACQVPHRFQRGTVTLSDESSAETHYMTMEQVRGKRRLGHGSWLERFAPRSVPHRELAFAQYARQRSTKR